MHRFTTTFVRSLIILAAASLAACDAPDDLDVDELDIDELELRVGGPLPEAGIPSDNPVKVSFSIPLQPVGEFKPKTGFSLHASTDLAYIYTPDPAGDPNMILVDANGVSPYSENLPFVLETVCEDFLELYPYAVPVLDSVESCAQVETGCCDRVCYLWGGTAIDDEGQNVIVPVDNETFLDTEMVWGTYVETERLPWNANLDNGGYDPRETACGCLCEKPEEEAP